jgi:hypothetical protein
MSDTTNTLNARVFAALSAETVVDAAADAFNQFTRSLMYHRFTGRPKRGVMYRIFAFVELHPKDHWLGMGVPESDLVEAENVKSLDGVEGPLYHPWWETAACSTRSPRRGWPARTTSAAWPPAACPPTSTAATGPRTAGCGCSSRPSTAFGRLAFVMHYNRAAFVERFGLAQAKQYESDVSLAAGELAHNMEIRKREEGVGSASPNEVFAYAVFGRLASQIQEAGRRNGE